MSKPNRSLDLLRECNDQGVSDKEFRETFCARCRNPQCVNAGWAGSTWSGRMSTQVDRLLTHPFFADPTDPRFEKLRGLEFRQVEAPIIWNPRDPWAGPSVHLVDPERQERQDSHVEEALKTLGEARVRKPEPLVEAPEVEPQEPEIQEPPTPEVQGKPPHTPRHYVLDTLSSVQQAQTPTVRVVNTPFPEEGVMLDGSPPPPPSKPVVVEVDPWAVKPTDNVVKVPVGARVRMGGDPKK